MTKVIQISECKTLVKEQQQRDQQKKYILRIMKALTHKSILNQSKCKHNRKGKCQNQEELVQFPSQSVSVIPKTKKIAFNLKYRTKGNMSKENSVFELEIAEECTRAYIFQGP